MTVEKNYENIRNLAETFKKCGYDVDVWWDANWYCIDNKTHYGIELDLDVYDGEGEQYSFIFNRKGQRINSCLEGELKNTSYNIKH